MSLEPRSITLLEAAFIKSEVSNNCEVLMWKILKQGTDTLETMGLCQESELCKVDLYRGMAQVDLQEFRVRDSKHCYIIVSGINQKLFHILSMHELYL